MTEVVLLDNQPTAGRWKATVGMIPFMLPGVLPAWVLVSGDTAVSGESIAPLMWVVLATWAAVPLVAVWVTAVHLCASEKLVVVDRTTLKCVRQVGRWRREWSAPIADIQELKVPGLGRESMRWSWGLGIPALEITSRGRPVRRCCVALLPSDAQAIANELQRLRLAA